jgi:hypothetical protein
LSVRLDGSDILGYYPPSPASRLVVAAWVFARTSACEGPSLKTHGLRVVALVIGLAGQPGAAAAPPTVDVGRHEQPDERRGLDPALHGTLDPATAAEVARLEAEHRGVLSEPVERWRLGSVQNGYEALLKRVSDPAASAAIRARIDLVAQHEQIGRSAREIQAILDRSRARDQAVDRTKRNLAALDRPQRRPYVAVGLFQASSREVEGRRVFALIGQNGRAIAYLDIPPGLDARPTLGKRIGVRGSVHYNEALGSRLIAARELEPLE